MGCCGDFKDVGIGQKIAGATKLIASEIGFGHASDSVIAERRELCESCDRWFHGRCKDCGCYTYAKTQLTREKCPLGKWGPAA